MRKERLYDREKGRCGDGARGLACCGVLVVHAKRTWTKEGRCFEALSIWGSSNIGCVGRDAVDAKHSGRYHLYIDCEDREAGPLCWN